MIESAGFSLESLLRGLLGMAVIFGMAYVFSENRKQIDWKLVVSGLVFQIILIVSILFIPAVSTVFEYCGKVFIKLVDFTQTGVAFLLGPYATKKHGVVFLIHSLPTVILFTALVSLFYHWKIIQRVVSCFSWLLRKLFNNLSGAEGIVVAGNIFLGMSEAPILAKGYLSKMNRSELFLVMVSGMSTIAGTVLGAYIGILGGEDPVSKVYFAQHLLTASVIAAPGAVILAKIFCPQTETIDRSPIEVSNKNHMHQSAMEALTSGSFSGLKIMANIASTLLVFIALVSLVNFVCKDLVGHYTGLNEWATTITNGKSDGFTIQFMLGAVAAPFMWLIGVPAEDMMSVGALLGQKTILNEFVAYIQMQQWKSVDLFVYKKSILMSTYLLCGFANISSVGILVGVLSMLVPEKKAIIAKLGIRSMVVGTLVSMLSATLVGMIIG